MHQIGTNRTVFTYLYAKIESILTENKPFKRNFHANKNFFESTWEKVKVATYFMY